MLQRSSILSNPKMISEEISIDSIFKLLSRADKNIENLSETLKNESNFKSQLNRKLDFYNVNSPENIEKSLQLKFENLKSQIENDCELKIQNILKANSQMVEGIRQSHEEELEKLTQNCEARLVEWEDFYQKQLDETLEKLRTEYVDKLYAFQGNSSVRSSVESHNLGDIKLQTFRNYVNPDLTQQDTQILSQELEKSRQQILQQEELKYRRFIEEFTNYRKQEVDMFKSSQISFVQNLQQEVNQLTEIVQKVIKNPERGQPTSHNIDLYNLQDSIENVSMGLQNYFTRVSHNSNEDSYFSLGERKEEHGEVKSQVPVREQNLSNKYL